MNASKNGTNTLSAKVTALHADAMIVDYCGKEYRIDFDRIPYFKSCFVSELYNIQASAVGLHWPDADIDLEIEYLEHPPEKSDVVSLEWWKAQRRRLLARLGAVGGSVRNSRKAAASRTNGAKGGRSLLEPPQYLEYPYPELSQFAGNRDAKRDSRTQEKAVYQGIPFASALFLLLCGTAGRAAAGGEKHCWTFQPCDDGALPEACRQKSTTAGRVPDERNYRKLQ